jgi:hypothetical protein
VDFGLQVRHMDGLRVEDRATIGRSTDERNRELADGAEGDRPVMGDEKEAFAVAAEDAGVLRLAQAGGALRHGVENRLDVSRRAADDAQDVAGGGLLVERRGELAVAGPQPVNNRTRSRWR